MMARIAGRQMARVLGYAAAPILLAPLLGPILAGAILKYAGWPWLFYVNLPIGILAVALAAVFVPHDRALIRKRPFDLTGFLLLSPGLALLLFGFEQASRREGYWGLAAGALGIGSFLWHAGRKKTDALIDLDLFRNGVFSIATITQFLSNGIIYAGQFLIPLFLTSGCGLTPTEAGWVLAPMGLGMMCVYPFMGRLTDQAGCRAVAVGGVVLNFVGTLPFLWMAHGQYSRGLALAGLFVRGLGQGSTGIPSLAAAYAAVPKERLSYATTAMNIVQRLGGPIATTALAIVVSLSGSLGVAAGPRTYFVPLVALTVLQLLVMASAIRLPAWVSAE
jgi:MFS family permease